MTTHEAAEKRVRRGFWIHALVYVLVVTGLAIMNVMRNPDKLWVIWVAAGWGVGLLAHGSALYLIPGGRERMIRRTADRMQRRTDRRGEN